MGSSVPLSTDITREDLNGQQTAGYRNTEPNSDQNSEMEERVEESKGIPNLIVDEDSEGEIEVEGEGDGLPNCKPRLTGQGANRYVKNADVWKMNSLKVENHNFLTTKVQVGPFSVDAYWDSLASSVFISQQLLQKLQGMDKEHKIHQRMGKVINYSLATGNQTYDAPVYRISLRIGTIKLAVDAAVAPLDGFELILGKSFMDRLNVRLSFPENIITVNWKGKHHKLPVVSSVRSPDLTHSGTICSMVEVEEALQNGDCLLALIYRLPQEHHGNEEEEIQPERAQFKKPVNLPTDVEAEFDTLLEEYKDVFEPFTANEGVPEPRVPGETCKIELQPSSKPAYRPYVRLSPAQIQAAKILIEDYINKGWLECSTGSPYGAPMLMVPKKDGTWRVVFDYRLLNNTVVKDRFPLPRIEDLIHSIGRSRVFSGLDATDGFYQVPMDPESKDKTAVVTPFGQYVWKVMPQGFCNSPSIFMRMVNRIFQKLSMTCVKCYLDDILVHSSGIREHLNHLREVFATCRQERLRLKLKKCEFFQQSVEYAGFTIEAGQVKCQTRLVERIQQFREPQCLKDNQQFLGLTGYYRQFILNYAAIARPLTDMNRKNLAQDWKTHWGRKQTDAFEALKRALSSAPVLKIFHEDLPTRVDTDASTYCMGATLNQKHEDGWHPVAFWSKRFNETQMRYTTTEQESLAIVSALLYWRHFLIGRPFTVITDHQANKYFQTKSSERLSPRELRWLDTIAQYAPFQVEYRPGSQHIPPDVLSRPKGADTLILRILDLCAGAGTVIRALDKAIPPGQNIQVDYVAIEIDTTARLVLQRVYDRVRLNRPDLFVRSDIFRLGNDIKQLTTRRKLPPFHLLLAGLPCQPFSRANNSKESPPLGLLDQRELFTTLAQVLQRLPSIDFIVECTEFAPSLQQDLLLVNEWLQRKPQLHDLSEYCAQNRKRYLWTTIEGTALPIEEALEWRDCLEPDAIPPLDISRQVKKKSPTLMASSAHSKSHSDRNGSNRVVLKGNKEITREMTSIEKERLVGLEDNDTAAPGVNERMRHQLCGNAFPVLWVAAIIRLWLCRFATLSTSPTGTRPLQQLPASHSLCAVGSGRPSEPLRQQILKAATHDRQYRQELANPPVDCQVWDGLLYKAPESGHRVLIVPNDQALRQQLVYMCHDNHGHQGQARTLSYCQRHFTWKGMAQFVHQYCARCVRCQLQKPTNRSITHTLHPFPPANYPFQELEMDEVTGFPRSKAGNDAVLTIVDRFTRYALYLAITTTISAADMARKFQDIVVYQFGAPRKIITDRGSRFTCSFWANFCRLLGSIHARSAPYHSQTAGLVERQHRTLLTTIRTSCADLNRWDEYLPAAAFAYNDTVHSAIGYSPFFLLHGRNPELPWHFQLVPAPNATADKRIQDLEKLHSQIYAAVKAKYNQLQATNQHRRQKMFKVGDLVKRQYGLNTPTDKHKLDPYYTGPYKILASNGNGSYVLELPQGSKQSPVENASRLEPWNISDSKMFPLDSANSKPAVVDKRDPAQNRWAVKRYLVRDWSVIPPRYWAELYEVTNARERFCYVDETPDLVDYILDYEGAYGTLPETHITRSNIAKVSAHKRDIYGHGFAICANTWPSSSMPFTTRRTPKFKPPTQLLNQIIQKDFTVGGYTMTFAGKVVSRGNKGYKVRYTDNGVEQISEKDIRSLLFNPLKRLQLGDNL